MNQGRIGFLPAAMLGSFALFYFVWAAMHDIAHGDEGTIEWTVLGICLVAFAGLYRQALRVLTSRAKVAWLIATGLLFVLFSVAAAGAIARPSYPKDPMLATTFLSAGLPVLMLIGYHLTREAIQSRTRRQQAS